MLEAWWAVRRMTVVVVLVAKVLRQKVQVRDASRESVRNSPLASLIQTIRTSQLQKPVLSPCSVISMSCSGELSPATGMADETSHPSSIVTRIYSLARSTYLRPATMSLLSRHRCRNGFSNGQLCAVSACARYSWTYVTGQCKDTTLCFGAG